jgi:hypothetical protein
MYRRNNRLRLQRRLDADFARIRTIRSEFDVDAEEFALHADEVVALLCKSDDDDDATVRFRVEAFEALAFAPPDELAKHYDALAASLEDEDESVRNAAKVALGRIPFLFKAKRMAGGSIGLYGIASAVVFISTGMYAM